MGLSEADMAAGYSHVILEALSVTNSQVQGKLWASLQVVIWRDSTALKAFWISYIEVFTKPEIKPHKGWN